MNPTRMGGSAPRESGVCVLRLPPGRADSAQAGVGAGGAAPAPCTHAGQSTRISAAPAWIGEALGVVLGAGASTQGHGKEQNSRHG